MCMVDAMQGQYYLVWDSYYTIGQRLKVLHKIRSQLQQNYMLGLYRHAVPNYPLVCPKKIKVLRDNWPPQGKFLLGILVNPAK